MNKQVFNSFTLGHRDGEEGDLDHEGSEPQEHCAVY